MTIKHRKIPALPECERIQPIAGNIIRSYPVGRQNFMRICLGETLTLAIDVLQPLPAEIQANLVTSINAEGQLTSNKIPFEHQKRRRLECRIKPQQTGLHSFRAEFSLDNGETWLSDNEPASWVLVDPPQVDGLIMYTLIPTVSGTMTDWKNELKHIKSMGFNAVHLLPITLLDSSQSPYASQDLFSIDISYIDFSLEKDAFTQLGEFVEEAKRLNIKLCFDLVLNHIGINSNICQKAPGWIVPDMKQPDGFLRASYWSDQGKCFWDDLALINYEHPSTETRAKIWSYMIEYALFWAKYANETEGFVRFDNLHSSNLEFIQVLTFTLHEEYPNLGILAEYFTDESTLLETTSLWRLNLILATPWDYKFVPQFRDYLKFIHRISTHVRYFMPVTSHDSGTPAQEFCSVESTIPRYVAAALLGTGATGIVQGVEYGEPKKIEFIGRHEKRKFPEHPVFGNFFSKVNSIFQKYQTFRQGNNCTFIDRDHGAIIAAFRKSHSHHEAGFVVACNFDIFNSHQLTLDIAPFIDENKQYQFKELFHDENGVIHKHVVEVSLKPCSAKVYRIIAE